MSIYLLTSTVAALYGVGGTKIHNSCSSINNCNIIHHTIQPYSVLLNVLDNGITNNTQRNYTYSYHNILHNNLYVNTLLQTRYLSSHNTRRGSRRYQDPDMRVCQSIEELTQMAHEHISNMSPRGMSAYWTLVSKLLNQRSNRPSNQLQMQMKQILAYTLKDITTFGYRDLAQTSISFAKIINKVQKRKRHHYGTTEQILQDVLIGKGSKIKQFIFTEITKASTPILHEFDARHLSNLIYSFGLVEEVVPVEDGSTLFDVFAEQVISFDNLNEFLPQHLSNISWAYATAGATHHQLFEEVADHIVQLDNLNEFWPQALSNTVWAYATLDEQHPKLFKKVADHIVTLDKLDKFNGQDCSNTVWAFATAGESHLQLFNKLADEAIKRQHEFTDQGTANFLWAYASNGQVDEHLFSSLVPSVKDNLDKYNAQELANVAWAYSVANVNAPSVFNKEFINACLRNEESFELEELRQLHQWQLWQEELKSDISLPSSLQKRCYEAFVSQDPTQSKLQDDVVSILSSLGLQPQEEVLLKSGYRIDAVVEVNGKQIAVEVDGPSHFLGRSSERTGSTILKHRQVAALDGMTVVSIPYWEWDNLENDTEKKKYVQSLLGFETN